jgi:hypothetical protein
MIINVQRSSRKVFCQMLIKLEISGQIFEKSSNFMKILPMEIELFHRTDGRIGRHAEANSLFTQFFNAP